jgi:hypothetical protein
MRSRKAAVEDMGFAFRVTKAVKPRTVAARRYPLTALMALKTGRSSCIINATGSV